MKTLFLSALLVCLAGLANAVPTATLVPFGNNNTTSAVRVIDVSMMDTTNALNILSPYTDMAFSVGATVSTTDVNWNATNGFFNDWSFVREAESDPLGTEAESYGTIEFTMNEQWCYEVEGELDISDPFAGNAGLVARLGTPGDPTAYYFSSHQSFSQSPVMTLAGDGGDEDVSQITGQPIGCLPAGGPYLFFFALSSDDGATTGNVDGDGFVNLKIVPEPTQLAGMGAGVGLLAFLARRRA